MFPIEQLRSPNAEGPRDSFGFADVPYGKEFGRIFGLARRPPPDETSEEAAELARFLTIRLAKTGRPEPGPLRPVQALALKEAWEAGGGVGILPLGSGKTLLDLLLPEVWQAERPLLMTTSKLAMQFLQDRQSLEHHWRVRPAYGYPILSYEVNSSVKSGELLDNEGDVLLKSRIARLKPTHIIFDEAHCLANPAGAGARRVKAYLQENDVKVWVQTGTLYKRSILDACHLFEWALGDKSPLPTDFEERTAWASYLDPKSDSWGGIRIGAGALLEFLTPEERQGFDDLDPEEQVGLVRRAIARRTLESAGVVGMRSPPLSIGLKIRPWVPKRECPGTEELFRVLRGSGEDGSEERLQYPGWRLPDGTEIADALSMARQATNAGFGYYQVWRPDPPEEWRFHRNAWSKWCRKAVKTNRRGIDSEARMKDAVKRGIVEDRWLTHELTLPQQHLAGTSRLANWEEAEAAERKRTGLLEPPSVPIWESEQVVEECRRWLEHSPGGLIWVKSIGLGKLLSKHLGIPYYGEMGLDEQGWPISRHRGGAAVASIAANGTGANLQGFWSSNLWLCTPTEQALGRTHRPGQKADCVENWVYIGCQEHLKSFYAARQTKGKFAEQMTLSPQKLVYADLKMVGHAELLLRGGKRWAMPGEED